jgi:hypothetical protein
VPEQPTDCAPRGARFDLRSSQHQFVTIPVIDFRARPFVAVGFQRRPNVNPITWDDFIKIRFFRSCSIELPDREFLKYHAWPRGLWVGV